MLTRIWYLNGLMIKGVVLQYVKRCKIRKEKKQRSHDTIRLDKASLNQGQRKEKKQIILKEWSFYTVTVPSTPSLSLINLLEGLREIYHLLDHRLFYKRIYNSGTAKWKNCIGQCMRKGCRAFSFPALSEYHCLSLPYSPTRKLPKPHPSGSLWKLH